MEIRISKSARTCLGCETDFVHDAPIHSLVRASEEALEREDFCDACWPGASTEGAISTWSTKFYDPRVAEAEPEESFSPLRQLFYEALESEDRLELAKAFLGAQLLRRQKVFRLVKESDEQDGEVKILLYTDRIGNRLIEVRDPHFTYKELDDGRTRLISRLQELEAPPEEETAETSDEVEHSTTDESEVPGEEATAAEVDDTEEFDDEEDEFDEDEFDDDDEFDKEDLTEEETTAGSQHEYEAREVTPA